MDPGLKPVPTAQGVLALALALATLGLAACATPGASPESADDEPLPRSLRCLRVDRIDNWRVIDSRQLIVYGPRRSEAWLLQLFPGCTAIRSSESLGFRTFGGDMLCGDPGDEVLLRDGRCAIRSMRRISPAEEAALTDPDVRSDIGKMPPADRGTTTEKQ